MEIKSESLDQSVGEDDTSYDLRKDDIFETAFKMVY